MKNLPDKPTLGDYQKLVQELTIARGFEKETVPEAFTVFVEEVGELAKAIRKVNGQKVDKKSLQLNVEDELADVFTLVLDLANRLNIDVEKAFRAKEAKNQKRQWQ
jgi:NTP pyrophosphatase (non-canonical NTP hydrolase)